MFTVRHLDHPRAQKFVTRVAIEMHNSSDREDGIR